MKKVLKTITTLFAFSAVAVTIWILFPERVITTDDAQIEQYISPINIKVPGYIKEIRFTEHQFVNKGDTLLIIDNTEYIIALKQAEAQLKEAQGGYKMIGNTLNTATTSASVYDSSIEEVRIRIDKLQRDYDRHNSLLQKNASTPVIVDQYKTELEAAKQRLDALITQRKAAISTISEVNQRQENAEATTMKAEAALEMAKLNLSYTVITAPCDGYLGRRAIEKGQLVSPGQSVTTIIPNTPKWVIANFKEKQTSKLKVGQEVEIEIDAIPNKKFIGKISAISAATGSKYSMIPTDNSAGNFVKIQQRIPVRIDFINADSNDNVRMAAGMMCVITVQSQYE